MDGKFNPTNVGMRPYKITIDSVRPGSIWLKGHPWMQRLLKEVRKEGIIKHIKDIKLNNENKKKVKDGIVFDAFDESTDKAGVFAVTKLTKDDFEKIADCEISSNYLYPPSKRSFTFVVRITSYVFLAVTMWKRKLYLKQVERKERTESDLESLNLKEPTFSLFNVLTGMDTNDQVNKKLTDYFTVTGVVLMETAMKGKIIRLNNSHLSAGLDYLYQKASRELEINYGRKYIKKISVLHQGVYFCKNRLLESSELRVVGDLSNFMNIESFTGVNYKVPVFDYYSPLSWSIANYLH